MNRYFVLPLTVLVCTSTILLAQERQPREPRRVEPHRVEHKSIVINQDGSYLGVFLKDITPELRASMKLSDESGALITQVEDGSPASEAGLRKEDVVVRFDGENVRSVAHLRRLIGETPAGRKVTLDVLRDGRRQSVTATLRTREGVPDFGFNFEGLGLDSTLHGRMKILSGRLDSLGRMLSDSTMLRLRELDSFPLGDLDVKYFYNDRPFVFSRPGRMGVELLSMSPQLAKYFGVTGEKGALIGAVADSSPAALAGLQAGDVIIAIDGQKVDDPADARRIVSDKPEGRVEVRIVRDRREQTIPVTLPKAEPRGREESFMFDGCFPFGGAENGRMFFHFFGPEGMPAPPMPPMPPPPHTAPREAPDVEFSVAPEADAPAGWLVL